jgi:hypothetical protein
MIESVDPAWEDLSEGWEVQIPRFARNDKSLAE